MLAKKAVDAAGMLGRMLRAVAHAYKAFKSINTFTATLAKMVSSFALNTTTQGTRSRDESATDEVRHVFG